MVHNPGFLRRVDNDDIASNLSRVTSLHIHLHAPQESSHQIHAVCAISFVDDIRTLNECMNPCAYMCSVVVRA